MSGHLLARILLAGCTSLLAAACTATPPPASDPAAVADYKATNDPYEPTNRVFYRVNNAIDNAVLVPVAKGYRYITPPQVRTSVANALANVASPVLLSNDILQGKPRRAGDTTMRFLINTTVGVAGLFDVATGWGYPAHDADFGETLALWGVGEGPFLYLPVLGPSNPRDASGFGVDAAADPFTWVGQGTIVQILDYSRFGISAVSAREALLDPVAQIKKTALDPYATFRSLYRQHRRAQIAAVRSDNRATIPVWFDH